MPAPHIHFIIGTKAQFIKMAPLMIELGKRCIPYYYIDTGQHSNTTCKLRETFGLSKPDVLLSNSGDIASITSAIIWMFKLTLICLRSKSWVRNNIFNDKDGVCLIHGDTASTLLALWIAKAAGLKTVHVEAGLRSFNIFNPFPEELIRIHCMKKCDILFAPSSEAETNLNNMNIKGRIYRVEGNTVVDSLRLATQFPSQHPEAQGEYILATCHRYETITNKNNLKKIINLLNDVSRTFPIIFVAHKPTRRYLEKFNLETKLLNNIKIIDTQEYYTFISIIVGAKAVITDGGSIQEECSYLDKPCLIIRNNTERNDGFGKNALLWKFDDQLTQSFIDITKTYKPNLYHDWPHPSEKIVEALIQKEN